MELLDSIGNVDTKATAKEVSRFFRRTIPVLLRMYGGTMASIQSPKFDGMPKSSYGNGTENKLIKRLEKELEAREVIADVRVAIERCSFESQQIIKMAMVEKKRDWQVCEALKYSQSRYYDLKRVALNEFADAFETRKHGQDLHILEELTEKAE